MMKPILGVGLALALFTLPASAQQGTITYEETIKLDIQLPPEMESMRDQIPAAQTTTKQLYFNERAALLTNAPTPEDEDGAHTVQEGDVTMRFEFVGARSDDQLYTNLEEGQVVDKRDFLGRTFRIVDAPATYAWRLTGEQSEYLGYACQKAVAEQDSVMIEAWFTPEIPVSLGPGPYNGLPGLILVVSVDDGRRTYTAQEVALGEVDEALLVPPTEGREVTRAEFDQIVEEKMEEMGATRGGGRSFMIRN